MLSVQADLAVFLGPQLKYCKSSVGGTVVMSSKIELRPYVKQLNSVPVRESGCHL